MKKDENKQTFFSVLTGAFFKYLKKNYPMVILTFATFLITVVGARSFYFNERI